jgi:hypothetical protein
MKEDIWANIVGTYLHVVIKLPLVSTTALLAELGTSQKWLCKETASNVFFSYYQFLQLV